jgi:hypothetical protein
MEILVFPHRRFRYDWDFLFFGLVGLVRSIEALPSVGADLDGTICTVGT